MPLETPLVIIGSSLLGILLVVGVAIRLFSGGAAVQAPPHATEQISLTGVRPVATAAAQAGAVPVTQVSFPAKTPVVDIEVNSGGTAGQEPVEIAVSLGEPAHTISKNEYVLVPIRGHGHPAFTARFVIRARQLLGDHHLPRRAPGIHELRRPLRCGPLSAPPAGLPHSRPRSRR